MDLSFVICMLRLTKRDFSKHKSCTQTSALAANKTSGRINISIRAVHLSKVTAIQQGAFVEIECFVCLGPSFTPPLFPKPVVIA